MWWVYVLVPVIAMLWLAFYYLLAFIVAASAFDDG